MIVETLLFGFILITAIRLIRRRLCKPDFRGQNIWITGASSGIGEALAKQLNKLGAYVIISARNAQLLQKIKQNCAYPDKVQVIQMDVTKFEEVRKISEGVLDGLNRNGEQLNILIENAGIFKAGNFLDISVQEHLKIMDVNFNSVYNHIQCVIRDMIKKKNGQIVGICSLGAKISIKDGSSYYASKAAMAGMLDSLRSQIATYGISVTNIFPGFIKTGILKNNDSQDYVYSQNVEKGMNVDQFAQIAVKAIYNKQPQTQINSDKLMPLATNLRNYIPNQFFIIFRKINRFFLISSQHESKKRE